MADIVMPSNLLHYGNVRNGSNADIADHLNQSHGPQARPPLRADDDVVVDRDLHMPPGFDQVAG